MELSFVTWNIWFDDYQRQRRTQVLVNEIMEYSPDFVALQEVTPDTYENCFKKIKNYYRVGDVRQAYDTLILSKHPCLNWSRYVLPQTGMGRNVLLGDFSLPSGKVLKVGTFHLESVFTGEGEELKKRQLQFIYDITPQNVILMGDTNITKPIETLFVDLYEKIGSPKAYEYTYSGSMNKNIRNKKMNSRVDRIYVKQEYKINQFFLLGERGSFYHDLKNQYVPPSDHYGIFSKLQI